MDYGVVDVLGLGGSYVLDILEDSVVYVSGAVTGHDYAQVCRDFADARDWLRKRGAAHVTTPTRLVDPSLDHEQAMRECIHELTKRDYSVRDGGLVRRPWYDLIVMLDGWKVSEGARLEREVAEECGIYVMSLNRLKLKHYQEHKELKEKLLMRETAMKVDRLQDGNLTPHVSKHH